MLSESKVHPMEISQPSQLSFQSTQGFQVRNPNATKSIRPMLSSLKSNGETHSPINHEKNEIAANPSRKIQPTQLSNPIVPKTNENILSVCWYMSPAEFYEEFPTFQKIQDAIAFYVHKETNRVVALFNLPEPIINNPTPITEQKSSPIKMEEDREENHDENHVNEDEFRLKEADSEGEESENENSKQASKVKDEVVDENVNNMIQYLEKKLDATGTLVIEGKDEPSHYSVRVKILESVKEKMDELLDTKTNINKGAYNKNFQKKFGDLFCWFLRDGYKISVSTKFMDNMSWVRLNKYLRGDGKFGTLNQEALNRFMIEFVLSSDRRKLNGNKIRDEICKFFYRARFACLQKGMSAVKALLNDGFDLEYFQIVKSWPQVVIHCYSKKHAKGKKQSSTSAAEEQD